MAQNRVNAVTTNLDSQQAAADVVFGPHCDIGSPGEEAARFEAAFDGVASDCWRIFRDPEELRDCKL